MLAALLLLSLSACGAGWHRVEPTPSTTIPPRQQTLVFHSGAVERWHATSISADNISGIPWLRPIECDSCRTALPLAMVDSVRVGDPSLGFRKSVALGFGIMIGMLWYICTQAIGCSSP